MPGKDYRKELKEIYSAREGRFDEVDVPRLDYLMIDGEGDPSKTFGAAFEALYSVAYPLKFEIKARNPKLDYVVMPPEALYHAKDAAEFARTPKDKWRWTLLMLQPVKPSAAELDAARAKALAKGVARADEVLLEPYAEGSAVQTLHLGPYSGEGATVSALHKYIAEHGFVPSGAHHEIYLNDPNRVAPEKIKTIVRQPVKARRVALAAGHARAGSRKT